MGSKLGQSSIPRCDSVTWICLHMYYIGYANRVLCVLEDDKGKTSIYGLSLRRTRLTFDSEIPLSGFGLTGWWMIILYIGM